MEVRCIKATKKYERHGKRKTEKEVLNVAAYCRVSTDEPDQKRSYESQRSYYRKKIEEHDGWRLVNIYADLAMTGTKTENRPALQKMMDDCRAGEIDLILTKSISRFARNTYYTLKYVRELIDLNIAIVFEEENINTLHMDGELMLSILSANYQHEVESISAHVKKGLKMKMERGELVGYSACYGYDYDISKKKLIVNEKEAEIVRYIFKRYLEGIGAPKIAKELENMHVKTKRGGDKWSGSTVNNIIKNEKYVGDTLQGKTYVVNPISKKRRTNTGEMDKYHKKDTHDAIVSREDFELAQEIRTNRGMVLVSKEAGAITRFGRQYAFSHMIECGFCGEKFVRRTWHKGTSYAKCVWQCGRIVREGRKECPHSITVSEQELEKAFMESFSRVMVSANKETHVVFKNLMEEVIKINEEGGNLKEINGQIKAVNNKIDRLVNLHIDGDIVEEDYRKQYDKLRAQIDALENKKSYWEKLRKTPFNPIQRLKSMTEFIEHHPRLEEFDRKIFETVIRKVVIGVSTRGKKEIDVARFFYLHGLVDDVVIRKIGKVKSENEARSEEHESPDGCSRNNGLTEMQYKSLNTMLDNGVIDGKVYKRTEESLRKINQLSSGFTGG